ncbi:MAG: glycosyltransferase family 4 protein [Methylococcales bacterium]|nr:glycosyltransferase family 4 protein [Methylococcales bacterium]
MKILHIVAGDLRGGAARGAYWLHHALIEFGIDSKVFTNSNTTLGDDCVISTTQTKKDKLSNIFRIQIEQLIVRLYKNQNIFSTGVFGIDFTKIKEYKEADIIHLHWINGSFINIKHLSKIDKPIIWTMRDMWPMTGGCHYAMECVKYKIGCGSCEQLNRNSNYDLSKFILNRKKKYLPKIMKIVGISNWLSQKAKESLLFKDFDIRIISNNIDTKAFFPLEKKIAKDILGIKTDKKIILLGSAILKDFYKGLGKYLEAINLLDNNKYFLCFFGNVDKSIGDNLGFEYKNFGYLNDNISLRLAYSCANVFVAPSLMDAFGKTLAESMSCGTPVVCFDATGPKDIVTHKKDGYKAKPFKSEDLASGIVWVLNADNYDELCQNARKKVLKEFEAKVVAKKYIELYEGILND